MSEAPNNDPETTLHVRRAIAGDLVALEWVVTRLTPLLRSYADYRLGAVLRKRCSPEDLVQDAWVAALPKLATLSERDGRYTPTLLRYLSNTILFRVQKLVRKFAKESVAVAGGELGGDDDEFAGGVLDTLPADRSGVITGAIRSERRSQVHAALASLESVDRDVVFLRGIEQSSLRATAAVVGLTPEAVAQRYRRALQKLRARLPGSVFDELAGHESAT
ncbi:MAG: sigma-70 family RNA polymerase sigma factor [bacterium]|nr:sigma-70 family RNA polymerase sigma factor [bacterium]